MRSKKMVILAHCILNVNSKVEGFEPYTPMIKELVDFLNEEGLGIIQLPCPELLLMGMRRWGVVKDQLNHPHAKEEMKKMIRPILYQIQSYHDAGYRVACVIGIDGSPSCGVNFTCRSEMRKGEIFSAREFEKLLSDIRIENEKGIFMELLNSEMLAVGEEIPFFGINEEDMENSLKKIREELKRLF